MPPLGSDGAGFGSVGSGLGSDGAGLGSDGAGLGADGAGLGADGAGLGADGAGLAFDDPWFVFDDSWLGAGSGVVVAVLLEGVLDGFVVVVVAFLMVPPVRFHKFTFAGASSLSLSFSEPSGFSVAVSSLFPDFPSSL